MKCSHNDYYDLDVDDQNDSMHHHSSLKETIQHRLTDEEIKLLQFIVLVRIEDVTWDKMKEFNDNIPHHRYNHLLDFIEIIPKNVPSSRKDTDIALTRLREITC
nr:hypothetical protein [Tanacetum cinerariifolium]